MGFSRQKSWGGLLFPSWGDLLDLGIDPTSLMFLALAGAFFTTEPPGKPLNLFPGVCTEDSGMPGVETGQQDPLSLDLNWPMKYLPSHVVDIDSTRVWSKAFSSSVTPTTFQVLSSIMWSGARVLDRADVWKVQSSPRILLDIPLQITEACRENTCPREALHVLCESTDIFKFCLFCLLSPKPRIWASCAF